MTTSGALSSGCAALEAYAGEAWSRAVCPYLSVLLGAPQGIVLLPITGPGILMANGNARTYLRDLGVPETAEAIRSRFLQLPERGRPFAEHADATSDTRTYRHSSYFFDGTHLLFIEDVTDRHRAESIAASVDVHNSTALLLTSVRRELEKPVARLKKALAELERSSGGSNSEDWLRALEGAVGQMEAVEELVGVLSVLHATDRPPPQPLRLDLFLSEFCEFAACAAEARDVFFSYMPFPPGATVLGDSRALRQALRNVIDNAFEAMEGVRGSSLEVRALSTERYVTIVVRDSGPGIPPGSIPHVFAPFFSTKKGHSGLGLATARNLVLGMRGDLEVRSELGVGTTVSVALQRVDSKASENGADAPGSRELSLPAV